MKLDRKRNKNWPALPALVAGVVFFYVAVIGCGSDDDDSNAANETGGSENTATGGNADTTTGGADDSTGGTATGGAAGSEAGSGGTTEDSITAEQKQAVCQCWFDFVDIHVPELNSQCEQIVTKSCVNCTEDHMNGASCADMDEAELIPCLDNCLHLVEAPETVDECKELVEAGTDDPEAVSAGTCMCDNCLDAYAPCMANSACLRVILCVAERGCNGIECMNDEVCDPIIAESLNADPSLIEPLTRTIANCSTEFSCQGQSTDTDGGTEDEPDGGTDGD